MTDTLIRPSRASSGDGAGAARPLLRAGLTAAVWAVGAGLVATALPVLLVWMADARSGSSAGEALRMAGQVWLVAHGVDLRLPGGVLGLAPLGLLLLPLALLLRAGGHTARECRVTRLPQAMRLAAAIGVPYGVLTAVVAGLARSDSVQPVSWQALALGVLVGGLGGLAGALRGAGLWRAVLPALPDRLAGLVISCAAAGAVLLGTSALLTGVALAAHLGRARELSQAADAGLVGGFALLLLGLSLIPNAVVWAAAWLTGPGFAVGTATAVGPFGHELGAVPGVPLLAALPGPVPTSVGLLVLLVPVAAGALAGRLVVRRLPSGSVLTTAREAALVGPALGAMAALACWASSGPLGGDRLVEVGPSPWRVGLVLALEIGLAAAASAALSAHRR